MTALRHFRERSWAARFDHEPTRTPTPRTIAEDRAAHLRESQHWKRLGPQFRNARYEALLSAYALRGVWPFVGGYCVSCNRWCQNPCVPGDPP
jgi:hypothetical protein